MKRIAVILSVFIICACGNNADQSSEPKMSEKAKILYEKAEKKIADVECRVEQLQKGTDAQQIIAVLSDAKKLEYKFDSADMNRAAIEKCKALQTRAIEVQEAAVAKAESIILQSKVLVYEGEDFLMEKMTEYPVYLEKGDVLYYDVKLQAAVPVKLYNMDARSTVRSYNKTSVKDSLVISYTGIYLLEVKPQAAQYASVHITYHTDNMDRIYNPKSVRTETVSCSKGDFRAYSVKGIKMQNIFEEPRKFTLRGQIKAAFSGSYRGIVAVQVPAGTTDILYRLRISTDEEDMYTDGKFSEDMNHSYSKIKVLGMPLYESQHSIGLIQTLLGDNKPPREEDAYINMFVFTSSSQAKSFQDGKATSTLQYNINYSTMGTQSCNGRIPMNGKQTIYLGFENERMRFHNYVWLEVIAISPKTEYFNAKYTIVK